MLADRRNSQMMTAKGKMMFRAEYTIAALQKVQLQINHQKAQPNSYKFSESMCDQNHLMQLFFCFPEFIETSPLFL